ncbi:MAG: hypothetical protein WAV41_02880 [Microgenomates group bacterium]
MTTENSTTKVPFHKQPWFWLAVVAAIIFCCICPLTLATVRFINNSVVVSVVPSATAMPAPAEVVIDQYACDNTVTSHCLMPGEKWTVPAGWNVSGDIKANGTSLYDNNAETGLVTHFIVATEIEAPWGAFASADLSVDNMVAKLKESGCGSSCKWVITKTYPQ